MKYLFTIAVAAAWSLTSSCSTVAQDLQIDAGIPTVSIANQHQYQFTNFAADAFDRRLNRYQNNYGYNTYPYRGNWYRQYGNSGPYGYRNYDYYGRNYGRTRDYRNYYRGNPNRGYYNGYYYRPGFYIGGGSSRIFFGF